MRAPATIGEDLVAWPEPRQFFLGARQQVLEEVSTRFEDHAHAPTEF
jgi:hypothetical protein